MSQAIETELCQLRRTVKILAVVVCALCIPVLIAATKAPPKEIIAHTIRVVDDKGVTRAVLAGSVPDPIINGKSLPRMGQAAGLIIYDQKGNERGGYLTSLSDEGLLTLDGAHGGEVFKVVANPDAGASLFLPHANGALVALTTYRGQPELQMVEKDGRALITLPADAPPIP
ncbi:hypothetical protein MMA231_04279 (plasmid) [Asticcacaulis sp. MM231]